MTSFFNIEAALINAYLAVDSTTPTGFPNKPLPQEDKPESGLWAEVHNLPAISTVATLGNQGEDNNPGVLQIDLNYPRDKGTGVLLQKADELGSAFPAGTKLTYNGQVVTITSCSLAPIRYLGGDARISLSLTYYARTFRNL